MNYFHLHPCTPKGLSQLNKVFQAKFLDIMGCSPSKKVRDQLNRRRHLRNIQSSLPGNNIVICYLSNIEHEYNLSMQISCDLVQLIQSYYDNIKYYPIQYETFTQHLHTQDKLRFKTFIIGDYHCGKKNFLYKFAENWCEADYPRYDGYAESAYFSKYIRLYDIDIRWNLGIYDARYDYRYDDRFRKSFLNMDGFFWMFDITNKNSFEFIKTWLKKYQERFKYWDTCLENTRYHGWRHSNLLIGQRCDLEDHRMISQNEAKKLANLHDMEYIEVSALNNTNIEQAHMVMLQCMIANATEMNIPRKQ